MLAKALLLLLLAHPQTEVRKPTPVLLPDPVGVVVNDHLSVLGRCTAYQAYQNLRDRPNLSPQQQQVLAALHQALSTFTTPGRPLAPNGAEAVGDLSGCATGTALVP